MQLKYAVRVVLACLLTLPAFATIASTAQHDVRTTGVDTNSGCFDPSVASPGTDFSQQNAAQVTYSDLVIGATTTQITSAAHAFGSTHVGNCINITGGTGFTAGLYEIVSVSGVTATLDRSAGTTASIGGTANLGGSLLTITQALVNEQVGNTIWIKSGTYTLTTTLSPDATRAGTVTFNGYGTTHGDNGTKPLITTATNAIILFTMSSTTGVQTWRNLSLSNTAGTSANGIQQITNHGTQLLMLVDNVLFSGFVDGINGDNSGSHWDFNYLKVINSKIINCTDAGIRKTAGTTEVIGSLLNNDGQGISDIGDILLLKYSVFSNNTVGVDARAASYIDRCVFYKNTTTGFLAENVLVFAPMDGNVFYQNGKGIDNAGGQAISPSLAGVNAFGANTTNYTGWSKTGSATEIALTADPFTAGATFDFSLNSAAGGGALLKGTNFPGITNFIGTGVLDVGPLQSAGSSSSGGNFGFVY